MQDEHVYGMELQQAAGDRRDSSTGAARCEGERRALNVTSHTCERNQGLARARPFGRLPSCSYCETATQKPAAAT
jgi:hypothetical protein